MQYTPGYASQFFSYTPVVNGVELQQPASDLVQNRLSRKRNAAANVCFLAQLWVCMHIYTHNFVSVVGSCSMDFIHR